MNKPEKIATGLVELEGLIDACEEFLDATSKELMKDEDFVYWGMKIVPIAISAFYGKPGLKYILDHQEGFWNEES